MKKKIWCIILTLVLSAGIAACGGKTVKTASGQQLDQDAQKGQEGEGNQGGQQADQAGISKYEPQLPNGKEEADIFIEPIEDISEDFIRGMDVSSVIALEESGVIYYNEQGEEEDLFRVLADAGVNYIRVRVWNNPYDKDGNGYGGGNNDVEKAAKIGARAAQYGMKLLVDFYYADFWADTQKQQAPKAWAKMAVDEKQQALYAFTKESLQTILDAGGDVGIVQLGNEINNGLAGEEAWEDRILLLKQGSLAVREAAQEKERDIRVAVHFTGIHDHDQTAAYAQTLADAGLDYDIFGVSYYPYWHGTMEHLETVLKNIHNSYGKDTLVLETSYCYTLKDDDGSAGSIGQKDLPDGYTASVQSQAACVRDVMAAASEALSLGVFYWEGAWIQAEAAQSKERFGCAWDNQAMFDAEGHPLASLNVFKYLEYGTSCAQEIDYIEETVKELYLGEELQLPETVNVVYNDRSLNGTAAVEWDQKQVEDIRTDKVGAYTVEGRLPDGTRTVCQVNVSKKNWLLNAGFEKNDISMWKASYKGDTNPAHIQQKEANARTGQNSFQFEGDAKQDFTMEQTVSGLEAGTYQASAFIQGDDAGKTAKIYLYAVIDGKTFQSEPVKLHGQGKWIKPVIKGLKLDERSSVTIGMRVKCAAGAFGTMDDFALIKKQEN